MFVHKIALSLKMLLFLQILQNQAQGGRPCPGPTVEYEACDYPCQAFVWAPGPWAQCSLFQAASCGHGVRRRTVR